MTTSGENDSGMDDAHVLGGAAALTLPPPVAGGTGPGAIVFGSGLPDPVLHPRDPIGREISRVLRDHRTDLGYSQGRGQDALCDAVAERLNARSDSAFTGHDVAVTAGASGALAAVANALVEPGQVVVCERSTYPAAVAAFRRRGASVAAVPIDLHEPDVSAVDVALLESTAEGPRATAIYVVAPFQSPTTATLSDEGATALIALAERHDLLVIVDDTYGEIDFGARSALPTALMTCPRVVHIGSFSKTLAPALRLGWVAGNRSVVGAIAATRTDLGASTLLQEAVAGLLASGEYAEHVTTVTGFYRRKRDVLLEGLDRECVGTARWRVPEGSFFVWLEIAPTTRRLALAAREFGVGFVPGDYFAVDGEDPHHIRLAYSHVGIDDLADGARRLAEALRRAAHDGVPERAVPDRAIPDSNATSGVAR